MKVYKVRDKNTGKFLCINRMGDFTDIGSFFQAKRSANARRNQFNGPHSDRYETVEYEVIEIGVNQ